MERYPKDDDSSRVGLTVRSTAPMARVKPPFAPANRLTAPAGQPAARPTNPPPPGKPPPARKTGPVRKAAPSAPASPHAAIGSPNSRAINMRWTSLVPSPISRILASRHMRATGYSFMKP